MENYATISDLETVWKALTDSEETKATELITEASSRIRLKAAKQGKDFDEMIADDEDLEEVVKGLVCNVVKNAMNSPIDQEAMTQLTMSAGGYSWSGTYQNPGGGIRFTKNDWKSIGLGSQRFGGIDIYGID